MSNYDYEFNNNEFPFYHKILRKNKSNVRISINNININQRKIRINSPTSLKAIKLLGYNISELEYLPFKEYLKQNPHLIGISKSMQQSYYDYIEKLRKERFNKIKVLRLQLKNEEVPLRDKRNQSCYNMKFNTAKNRKYDSNLLKQEKDSFEHTAIENEKKILERMRNKNETEIINKIQFELKRELARKKNQEKIEEQNRKLKIHERKLQKIKKEEEIIKRNKEQELIKKQQELEIYERELNKQKYNEEMSKAKEEQKKEKAKMKMALLKHQEEEKRRIEFQEKINKIIEDKQIKILEKAKILQQKEVERKRQMERKNKEQQELNMQKSLAKQEQIENALKKFELKQEEIRKNFEIKEKENEEKRKRYEKLIKEENEKKLLEAQKKEEEIKQILENNEILKQKKIENYYEKQRILQIKREEREKINEIKKKERQNKNEEKEQKIKDTLIKNNEILIERKNKIMNDIKQREYNTQKVWRKRQKDAQKAQEEHMEKKLEKEFRVKEIAQQKENKINDTRMKLYDKDKKVESFMKQKHLLNEQKRNFSEQISKQKQMYSEKFENLFNKKNIDEETLAAIKNMFPHSHQISEVIKEFNELMRK